MSRLGIGRAVCAGAMVLAGVCGSAHAQFVEAEVGSRVGQEAVTFGEMDLFALQGARSVAEGVPPQFAVRQNVALSAQDVGVIEEVAKCKTNSMY